MTFTLWYVSKDVFEYIGTICPQHNTALKMHFSIFESTNKKYNNHYTMFIGILCFYGLHIISSWVIIPHTQFHMNRITGK